MTEPPPQFHPEREVLLDVLAVQRQSVIAACHGLTETQARATPTASSLSLGGLVKHIAFLERNWIAVLHVFWAPGPKPQAFDEDAFERSFQLDEGETITEAVDGLRSQRQSTEAYFRSIPAEIYQQSYPMPKHPWLRFFSSGLSPRFVLAHLVDDVSRHAGHADIIRESIDGRQADWLWQAALGFPPDETTTG